MSLISVSFKKKQVGKRNKPVLTNKKALEDP